MLYLVCTQCGEAFDASAPEITRDHAIKLNYCEDAVFAIQTEEEAF